MKKLLQYIFVLMFGLYGCSSQKKLSSEAPFSVTNPTSQEFASGREEGGSGVTLKIPLEGLPSGIQFEQVYFRAHLLKPQITDEGGLTILVCKFRIEMPEPKKDLIMHADPMEEVGNQPPALLDPIQDEFPFDLNPDEAVLEYREEGKRKSRYYKISGIKEKMPVQYPSRPQN